MQGPIAATRSRGIGSELVLHGVGSPCSAIALHRAAPAGVDGGHGRPRRGRRSGSGRSRQRGRQIADAGSSLTMPSACGRRPAVRVVAPDHGDRLRRAPDCQTQPIARARPSRQPAPAIPASPLRSSRSPVVKTCACDGSSGRQREDRPHGACVHSNPPLGWGWVMNIIGIGFDATESPRIVADVRSATAIVSCSASSPSGEIAYCTRRRDPVPHLGGAVRRQGSGDEGARHRPLARRPLEGHRSGPRRAVRRNCGCTAARRAAPRPCTSRAAS